MHGPPRAHSVTKPVTIDRPQREVHEYVADGRCWSQWAVVNVLTIGARRWTPTQGRFLLALAIAAATLLPAVAHAQTSPETIPASGTFALVHPPEILSVQTVGDVTSITQRVQYRLTGTLTGTAVGEEQVTFLPNGTAILRAELTFTGTVDGRSGTLRIVFTGTGTTDVTRGEFVLLSGTGDLATLRGQGSFVGFPQTGTGTYTGVFQFAP